MPPKYQTKKNQEVINFYIYNFHIFSDARQGNCFTSVTRGICHDPLSMRLSKRDCCCGMNMGKAWGDLCDLCPPHDDGNFVYNYQSTRVKLLGTKN